MVNYGGVLMIQMIWLDCGLQTLVELVLVWTAWTKVNPGGTQVLAFWENSQEGEASMFQLEAEAPCRFWRETGSN